MLFKVEIDERFRDWLRDGLVCESVSRIFEEQFEEEVGRIWVGRGIARRRWLIAGKCIKDRLDTQIDGASGDGQCDAVG